MEYFSTAEAYHVLGRLLDASEHPKASLDDRLVLVKQCWEALQACGGSAGAHQGSGVRVVGGHASPATHHDSQPTPASSEAPLSDTPPHQEPQQQEVAAMEEGSTMLWQALGQQQYLLALDLYMSPDMEHHAAADMLACQLGMTWRLSDSVWATCQCQEVQPCSMKAGITQNTVQTSVATASHGSQVTSFSPPLRGAGSNSGFTGTISNTSLPPHNQQPEGAGGKGPVSHSQSPAQSRRQRPHVPAPHQLPLPKPNTFRSPLILASGTAVSCATLQALTTAFTTTSPYWSDHGYFDPDTPFFSYTYDLRHPPSSIVEVAAQEVRQWARAHTFGTPVATTHAPAPESGRAGQGDESNGRQEEQGPEGTHGQEVGEDGAAALAAAICSATHVEWWAHTRAPDAAHQLHFDCDETKLRKGRDAYTLRHPTISSVLFLTHHGGPTLVLDQAPGAARLADRAWVVQPEPGALLAFPGNLLHGVLPGGTVAPEGGMTSSLPTQCDTDGVGSASVTDQGRDSCMGQRVTLVLAWWDRTHPAGVGGSSTQGPLGVSSPNSSSCSQPGTSSVAAAASAADVVSTPPQGVTPAIGPSMHPTPSSSGLVEDNPSLPSSSATLRPQMLPPWSQGRKKRRVQGADPAHSGAGEEAAAPANQAAVGGVEHGGDELPAYQAPGVEVEAMGARGPPSTVVEKSGQGGGGAGQQQHELGQGRGLSWVQLFTELAGARAREGVLSEGNDADADQGACSGQWVKPAMCVSPVWVSTQIQGPVHVGTNTEMEPSEGGRRDVWEIEKGAGSAGTVACTAAVRQPSACLALLQGALPDLRLMLPDEEFINAMYPVV